MLKTITIFILFGFYANSNAQTAELLKGKWIFKDAVNKGIDDAGRETLNSKIINKLTFEFKDNGKFTAFLMGQNQNGNWSLTDNSKSIILKTIDANVEIIILELTKTKLKLKLGLGTFIMQKQPL